MMDEVWPFTPENCGGESTPCAARSTAQRAGLLLPRSRFFRFVDHALLDLARHFFVATELLRVNAASAGERAQNTSVAVELHRWNVGPDDLKSSLSTCVENSPATAGKIAHHFAHAIFGNAHLDL